MKRQPFLKASRGSRQQGFALIAFLALIAMVAAYVIADALSKTSSELKTSREDRTMNALRQAKAALIAYAGSEQWQLACGSPPCRFQPGALPCPDRNNDGASDGICPSPLARIGRLPWKTIGADDLRDASGEQLWYAVSSGFVKNWGTTVINSDLQGQLTVNGNFPAANVVATNVVAIVFAPGGIAKNTTTSLLQLRDSTNASVYNEPANYLEQFNTTTYATFTTAALPSDDLNDRLLTISQAELMAAVEPVVAARIQRDIVINSYLDGYRTTWGRYPYAAPFNNPGGAAYQGQQGTFSGLLPVTSDPTFVTWASPSHPSVVQISGDIE